MYDLPPPPAYIYTIGSIVKLPPADRPSGNVPYSELVCTSQDQENIAEIITAMAENGKVSLLFMQTHLKQLGAEINHVHPLKFLSTIFTNDRLKLYMNEVFDDYFKRNGFLEGLGPSLTKEADKNKLAQYAEPFAQEVCVPVEQVQQFFQSRDWESFVRFLMQHRIN
jgi:hypothetical protein